MTTTTVAPSRRRCQSTGPHGTYWAYSKGCRCFDAALDESEYRGRRRAGNPIELVTDAAGACDIARGLAAYGYTTEQIADAAGISVRLVFQLQAGKDTIRTSKDRALRAAAERLIAAPSPTGYAATVARGVASRKGWTTTLAWTGLDGRSISDAHTYDPVIVGFAVEGRLTYAQIAGHRPDLIETVRRLAKSNTDTEIAHLLRWPGVNEPRGHGSNRATNSITKLRADNGIPAYTRPASIAPRVRTGPAKAA